MLSRPDVGAILLAAGASVRLGQPKQLVKVNGQSLLRRAAEAATGAACHPVVVVLGAHAALMRPELAGLPVQMVENTRWKTGMASSLQVGLAALPDTVQGVAVLVCDQPGLSSQVMDALISAWQAADAPLAVCEYAGILGVPAVFGRVLFPELITLHGPEGAKRVITRHADQAVRVPFADGAWDINTPEDLAKNNRKCQADVSGADARE